MRLSSLALAGVLVLGLASCTSEEPAGESSGESSREEPEARSKVLQPGRPGEANATVDPDTEVGAPATNEADIVFMQMMVPHHAQALQMSELARTRAASGQVADIARRIQAAQAPEIVAMQGWLESRGLEAPRTMADAPAMGHGGHGGHEDHGGHGGHEDHGGHAQHGGSDMHGMLTEQEMRELADASGAEFDRLFLAGMIRHHEGAVSMARDEMEAGSETLALELAADVAAGQSAEIGRLVDIRNGL